MEKNVKKEITKQNLKERELNDEQAAQVTGGIMNENDQDGSK